MVALLTTDPAPGLPALSAAVCAVCETFRRLHVTGDYCPRDARRIEDDLPTSGALAGTLTILDPLDVLPAEREIERTLHDERPRFGGLYLSQIGDHLYQRWTNYSALAWLMPVFAFTEHPQRQHPGDGVRFALAPDALDGFRVVLADTPGYRVAVIGFFVRKWGVALWTGNPQVVNEVGGALRVAARESGHAPHPPAAEAPSDCGLRSEADVRRMANVAMSERAKAQEATRELCRQAAIQGAKDRRARAKRWLRNGTLARG